MLQRSSRWCVAALAATCVALSVLPGCVERKLIVRSDPPGAVVLLDNRIVGTTPFETSFVHYGGRVVEVRWDPFEQDWDDRFATAREERFLAPPVYQWFPLDFVFEYLNPFTITDERLFEFDLKRAGSGGSTSDDNATEQVIRRSERMRSDVLRGEG